MSVIRLTKEFSFEMAHSLSGYDGACREIHGHSYKLFVTVQGEPNADPNNPKYGMVMDFGELKRIVGRLIVDRYDHALVVRRTAENSDAIDALRLLYNKIEVCDYQPTCANTASRFAEETGREPPPGTHLFRTTPHQTATSFAEWYRSDN